MSKHKVSGSDVIYRNFQTSVHKFILLSHFADIKHYNSATGKMDYIVLPNLPNQLISFTVVMH
jgi:hypothetical protein